MEKCESLEIGFENSYLMLMQGKRNIFAFFMELV